MSGFTPPPSSMNVVSANDQSPYGEHISKEAKVGGGMDDVRVSFEWTDDLTLTVDSSTPGIIEVTAHPGLNESHVSRACAELGGSGEQVLDAWRAAVSRGITPSAR